MIALKADLPIPPIVLKFTNAAACKNFLLGMGVSKADEPNCAAQVQVTIANQSQKYAHSQDTISLATFGREHSKQVMLFGEHTLLEIEHDERRGIITQTAYDNGSGNITISQAMFSNDGRNGKFEIIESLDGQNDRVHETWLNYHALLLGTSFLEI